MSPATSRLSHLPPPPPPSPIYQNNEPKNYQLSVLNIATLLVLDSCHFSIHRGSTYWSPGYGILLMGAARVAMMASMANLWLMGYSIAFVVYGGALAREVRTGRWLCPLVGRANLYDTSILVFLHVSMELGSKVVLEDRCFLGRTYKTEGIAGEERTRLPIVWVRLSFHCCCRAQRSLTR